MAYCTGSRLISTVNHLLFLTCHLDLSEHLAVFGSSVETKFVRFSRFDPWSFLRSRCPTGESRFWLAILREVDLPHAAVSRVPGYGRSTVPFTHSHRIGRCCNRRRGCSRTGSWRICFRSF